MTSSSRKYTIIYTAGDLRPFGSLSGYATEVQVVDVFPAVPIIDAGPDRAIPARRQHHVPSAAAVAGARVVCRQSMRDASQAGLV